MTESTSDASEARRTRSRILAARESAYHQARILLLIDAFSGTSGKLDGLTKLAKLDFLLRYPTFLEQLSNADVISSLTIDPETLPTSEERLAVESRMLRYKYGPWDDRYYGIIGALVGRGLVEYVPSKGRVALRPTEGGQAIADSLRADPEWSLTSQRCEVLRRAFQRYSGNALKELIYKHLPEVVDRPHRTEI